MIVICCGMPRSGSTWHYQVAAELVESYVSGYRIGFLPAGSFLESAYVNAGTGTNLVLKCHDYHPYYGRLCKDGLAKAIYSFRDIREVVPSVAWKLGISTMEAIHSDSLQQAIISYYKWTATPNLLMQRYEMMTSQPEKAVLEISSHLEITISDKDADLLAQKYSKEANRKYADRFRLSLLDQGVQPEKDYLLHDQFSLLHWNHFQPESTRGWRDLSPEELGEMGDVVQQWLLDTGLETNRDWVFSSGS